MNETKKVKLHYESQLEFQKQAIASVVNLFKGLAKDNSGQFTVARKQYELERSGLVVRDVTGVSNRFSNRLSDMAMLENLKSVQRSNFLHRDTALKSLEFDVEMETGTGKTYVYLRTIYELHRTYGFSKFLIIVPTKPIRSGVAKSLESMKDHFQELYPTTLVDEPLIYEDGKIQMVNTFAESGNLTIMVMIAASINRENNLMNNPQDGMNGCKPIDLLRETHPIVIVDEPQKLGERNSKSQKAIRKLEPLFILNYSATHRDKHALVYRLGPVESYQQRLVKRIDVWGADRSEELQNTPVINLKSVNAKDQSAKLECYCIVKGKVSLKTIPVKKYHENGDKRYDYIADLTNNDLYNGYIVKDIYFEKGAERVEFENGVVIKKGQVNTLNDAQSIHKMLSNDDAFRRIQIRETIQEHLRKERSLLANGIKVLSLFFIDDVDKYFVKTGKIVTRTGEYAKIFEEEYQKLIQLDAHKEVREYWQRIAELQNKPHHKISEYHNGYCGEDKNGLPKNTKYDNEIVNNEETKDDKEANARAIHQILEAKESLLSVENPLRFIFSHSALQEGWDNPNVFQICTLAHINSDISKRQRIGRGMRLPVDQNGIRIHNDEINVLTVFANETVEKFASDLQRNYEDETGIKFGRVNTEAFRDITCIDQTGIECDISPEAAEAIENWLKENHYLNEKGDVTDALRTAIADEHFELPDELASYQDEVERICKEACVKIEIRNVKDRVSVRMSNDASKQASFDALWNRIKAKTQYEVALNEDELVRECCNTLREDAEYLEKLQISFKMVDILIDHGGIRFKQKSSSEKPEDVVYHYENYPNILSELQKATHLTRHVLARIITESGTIPYFVSNPRGYIAWVLPRIATIQHHLEAESATYYLIQKEYDKNNTFKSEDSDYYDANLINRVDSTKSLYDHIRCQSETEKQCIEMFEANERVKMYAKLPEEFTIPTPVTVKGYNPDWAVICEGKQGQDELYFVYESKSTSDSNKRRIEENDKIECAKKHFAVIAPNGEVLFRAGSPDNMKKVLWNC